MCSRSRPSKPPAGGPKAPARANIPGSPLSNTGCVGAVGTPSSMGGASPRRDDGSKFEDAAGATPFHHSPMPLSAPIWPAIPDVAGDVAGADVLGAPSEGFGRTDGLVGVPFTAGATRDPPKASDRNSPGTSNGPTRCGVSGAKCSGGSVGSTAGVVGLAGADEREGAGGTRGLRGPGPPVAVGPSAPGMGLPGGSCVGIAPAGAPFDFGAPLGAGFLDCLIASPRRVSRVGAPVAVRIEAEAVSARRDDDTRTDAASD